MSFSRLQMFGMYSVVTCIFALAGITFYGAVHYTSAYFDVAFPWPEVCGNIFMMIPILVWTWKRRKEKVATLTNMEYLKSVFCLLTFGLIVYGAKRMFFKILAGLIPTSLPLLLTAEAFTNGMLVSALAMTEPQRNRFVLKYFPDKISNA